MKFFLIGIKGSGMAALAIYLKKKGFEVEGIDIDRYIYTQDELISNNINFYSFEDAKLDYVDVIILGHSFVDKNLKIIEYAKYECIPIYEYNEFINLIQNEYKESVAICGSHGKTTMTKLMQHCLNIDKNISSIVGDGTSSVEKIKDYFVFEACEYQNHFLSYYPNDIIILNIDYDHNDYFKTLKDYQNSYTKFANNAKSNVFIHESCIDVIHNEFIYTFGQSIKSSFNAQNIELAEGGYCFDFYIYSKYKMKVKTRFYARFMVDMCVGILGYACVHNFDLEKVVKSIPLFGDVKKRNQEIIINDDIFVIDYAHHPTQINAMIDMCKNKYQGRKIVAIYKPDRYSRVQQFYKEIAQSLLKSDISYVDDFPSNILKDVEEDISIYNIINEGKGKIRNLQEINNLDFDSKEYYVFLLMSSKDVNPIMKKIIKIRD